MSYYQWTIGKIKGSETKDLDKRVQELINLRESLTKSIQDEIDFIYDIVARREMEGKA